MYLPVLFQSSKTRLSKTLGADSSVLHITENTYSLYNFNFVSNYITYKKIEASLNAVLHKHQL